MLGHTILKFFVTLVLFLANVSVRSLRHSKLPSSHTALRAPDSDPDSLSDVVHHRPASSKNDMLDSSHAKYLHSLESLKRKFKEKLKRRKAPLSRLGLAADRSSNHNETSRHSEHGGSNSTKKKEQEYSSKDSLTPAFKEAVSREKYEFYTATNPVNEKTS